MTLSSTGRSRMQAGDRRAQLLDTALTCFSQKGFDAATTKEIAAAAGVTEAIVFRHFPTKHALYQAVLEAQSPAPRKWMEIARDCMQRGDDEALMRAIAEAVLEPYRSDPRMERLMLFAALEGQETALNYHRTSVMPIYELLRDYLLRRQQEGALLPFQPGTILSAICGMAKQHAFSTRLFGFESEISDDEAIDNFTRILMNGIQPGATK